VELLILCGSRLHNKFTARGLTFFDDTGFSFLICIHAYTDTLVLLPIFAKGSAFLVLSGAACFPVFEGNVARIFFPRLVRCSLTVAEDLLLPLKQWYLSDALVDLSIGHLGPFRCKLCMSMRFQKILGEVNYGREIHMILQESWNPAFRLWQPPA
jgi:hypothetical protein